jgi:hypothetical protein
MVRRRIDITTVTSAANGDGEDRCDDQRTCPGVHRVSDRSDTYAVPMHYDPHGRFLGAEVAPRDRLAEFVRDRDRAWAAAEPFDTWWARHHELHRRPAS